MDLSCFGSNYIGIRGGCDNTTPSSGLYINDVAGISLKLASHLADEETIKGETLLRRIEQTAIRDVWSEVRAKLAKYYELGKVVEQIQSGRYVYDQTVSYLPVQAGSVGVVVDKTDCDDYTAIRINSVQIRANSTVMGKTLTITDGCTTKDYTFDIAACQPTKIFTNYTANTGRVIITIDGTDVQLEDSSSFNNCGCRGGCGCDSCECINVRGWDGTQEVGQSYGFIVNASCVCDDSSFLCALQDEIASLVQLKMAVLLMQDLLTTKRCNFMVKNSDDDAKQMLILWIGGIDNTTGVQFKGEYWGKLSEVVMSVRSSFENIRSKCVSCGQLKVIESIP